MILYLIPLGFEMGSFGYSLLLLTFFVTWSTDTFAYFLGIKFGKKKLCSAISPKKTVEGSIGGLIGSVLTGIIVGWILNYFYINISFIHFIVIGLIGGIFSQIGDLTASAIKRFCGIKDFGKLLPGHGGLLDRFDSLLFTAPLIYFYVLLFMNV
jgi:phosphatidate cytidylyltransferase